MTKRDVYAEITEKMVAALEAGTVPWQKPWNVTPPRSMATGKPYRGVNLFILGLVNDYQSNSWGTYKQITERGGQVRKGEKSTAITFWKKMTSDVTDANGNKVYEDGKVKKKNWMMIKFFNVFNADQADWPDGMPEAFQAPAGCDFEPLDEAQKISDGYFRGNGPHLSHGWDRACYIPVTDQVQMPDERAFHSPEDYYSTLFHEATHSTGHGDRLAREGVVDFDYFGSHRYGLEELTAEMGAAMLSAIAGIETTFDNSAAYLASWIETIREDPKMVVQAAGRAQKACDLILGVTHGEGENA